MDRITEALERAQAQEATLGEVSLNDALSVHTLGLAAAAYKAELVRGIPGHPPIAGPAASAAQEKPTPGRADVAGGAAELIDSVKAVSTRVVQRMHERGWQTLAVVSPNSGEGKTFMAINLAVSIAAQFDQQVLLVDGNLRHPAIHQSFGIPPEPGLANVLVDHAPLDPILVTSGIDRLALMPAGRPQTNSAELLGSHQMAALVADIKSRYSDGIVVIDLPSLLGSADPLAFAPLADAVVMVVEDNHSNREDVTRSQQLLNGMNLIGVILNKARDRRTDAVERFPGFLQRLLNRG